MSGRHGDDDRDGLANQADPDSELYDGEHTSFDAASDDEPQRQARGAARTATWNVWSPNRSGRGGAVVRSLIIHTAEGATTADGLAAFLARSSSQVSYHAVCDDKNTIQCVPYDQMSWSARSANATADQFCTTGFARWDCNTWLAHAGMLEQTAAWIAARATARGIPIVKLSSADVAANRPGVFGHVNWTEGKRDGTHTDPGPNFPWDVVIARARVLAGQNPAPSPSPAPAPAPTPSRRLEVSVQNFTDLTGNGWLTLGCPVGPGTWNAEGVLSVTVPAGKGSARVFAQGTTAGVADWWHPEAELTVNTTPGQKDTNLARRSVRAIPAGTSVLKVNYDFSQVPGGGTVTVELR